MGIGAASFSLQPCQAILVVAALSGCAARQPERPRAPRHSAGSREHQEVGQGQGHLLTSHSAKNATRCQALGKDLFFFLQLKIPVVSDGKRLTAKFYFIFSSVF